MRSFVVIIMVASVISSCGRSKAPSYNEKASDLRLGAIDFNPLEGQLVSSGIDTPKHQMFTLYGNPVAVNHVRFHAATDFPAGSVLSKVTWQQEADPHWFGANIPAGVVSVEVVRFVTGTDGIIRPVYRHYSGDGSGADAILSVTDTENRINAICGVQASVMP